MSYNETPAWANARNREDFMRVARSESGADDILLRSSYTETKSYYVSNSPLHFAGEPTRSETEVHRSRLNNRSWADEVYREALSNASPWAVLGARETLGNKPYYAAAREQALDTIAATPSSASTFVTYADIPRMQPDELTALREIASNDPRAARVVFGMDANGGYSRRPSNLGDYPPEIMEAAARNMVTNDPSMADVLARDSRYSAAFAAAGMNAPAPAAGAAAPAVEENRRAFWRPQETGSSDRSYRDLLETIPETPQPQRSSATAEALNINAADGFNAREKQVLLEAAGFATDGGPNARADGRVDGKYGTASRAAENEFSVALVTGSLQSVDPEVLRMARQAFSSSITNAVNTAATEAAVPAAAAGVRVERDQGAER